MPSVNGIAVMRVQSARRALPDSGDRAKSTKTIGKRTVSAIGGRRKVPDEAKAGMADQPVVEFALSVIVFLMLLFGMIGFGVAVYDYNFVSDAAREGARYASVHGKDGLSPLTTTGAWLNG